MVVALDSKEGRIVVKGWRESTDLEAEDMLHLLEPYCGGFLCTYVDKEGMMQGTDLDWFNGTADDLRAFVASTITSADVAEPPPPDSPPTIVPKPLSDGGTPAPIDCSDGCCVAGK